MLPCRCECHDEFGLPLILLQSWAAGCSRGRDIVARTAARLADPKAVQQAMQSDSTLHIGLVPGDSNSFQQFVAQVVFELSRDS